MNFFRKCLLLSNFSSLAPNCFILYRLPYLMQTNKSLASYLFTIWFKDSLLLLLHPLSTTTCTALAAAAAIGKASRLCLGHLKPAAIK